MPQRHYPSPNCWPRRNPRHEIPIARLPIDRFMLCCICKEKEATVHLTQIAGDKMQKVDLCEECAKTKGVNDPTGFSLADLLLGLGASDEIEKAAGGAEIKCPRCGFTQADF